MRIDSSTTSIRAFRRRLHPSGSNISPHTSGSNRHWSGLPGRTSIPTFPVEISTVTLPMTPPASVSVMGLKVHSALAGSVPHTNVNVPCEPFRGVITNV